MGENRIMADLYAENERLKARIEELESKHFVECTIISQYDDELKEAKRLLGEALRTLNDGSCTKECRQCKWCENGCEMSCRFAWKYGDEVSALIGDENDAK